MSDHADGKGLDREAASYYKLGNLLRKERSELKARLVQAISHENISTDEKIRQINAIDLKPEGESDPHEPGRKTHVRHLDHPIIKQRPVSKSDAKSVPRSDEKPEAKPNAKPGSVAEATPSSDPPRLKDPAAALSARERRDLKARFGPDQAALNPQAQQTNRARLRAMREPEQGGLFNFLFSEFWKIKKFGGQTNTLEQGGWPFTFLYAPAVSVFLDQTIKGEGLECLRDVLTPALRKGWMFLEKSEYNLLAALSQVVAAAQRMECRAVKGRTAPFAPSFSAMASLVYVFNIDPDLLNRLCSLLAMVCERSGTGDQIRAKAIATIHLLLDCRDSSLNVPNIIRAIWMRQTHRYLEYRDFGMPADPAALAGRRLGPDGSAHRAELARYFSNASFDCSLEVQQEIDRHIASLVNRLDSMDIERVEMARWRSFLPLPQPAADESAKFLQDNRRPILARVDMGFLKAFYEGQPVHRDYDFATDQTVPLLLVVRFLDLFVGVFDPLLVTGIKAGPGRQEILQRALLSTQFAKLEFLRERLQEAVVALPHLGQSKYRDLVAGSGSGSDAENLMVARVKELASVLINTGKAVADVIRNRSALAPISMRAGQIDEPAYPLPAEALIIQSADSLNGLTVLEGLIMAGRIALQAGLYFDEGEMDLVLKRELELTGQLQPVREGLERLASDEQISFLRSAYPAILGA